MKDESNLNINYGPFIYSSILGCLVCRGLQIYISLSMDQFMNINIRVNFKNITSSPVREEG